MDLSQFGPFVARVFSAIMAVDLEAFTPDLPPVAEGDKVVGEIKEDFVKKILARLYLLSDEIKGLVEDSTVKSCLDGNLKEKISPIEEEIPFLKDLLDRSVGEGLDFERLEIREGWQVVVAPKKECGCLVCALQRRLEQMEDLGQ